MEGHVTKWKSFGAWEYTHVGLSKLASNVNFSYFCSNKHTISNLGYTHYYICANTPHRNKWACIKSIVVRQPDGTVIHASYTAHLYIAHLANEVTKAQILPRITNKVLLLLGQFSDNSYEVYLTKNKIYITHNTNSTQSLTVYHNHMTGKRTVDISSKNKST